MNIKRILPGNDVILLIVFLVSQFFLWQQTSKILPELHILPRVPSFYEKHALPFGDDQFYFRIAGYRLQNAGDTFGRVTPLKDYDYKELSKWLMLLDEKDPKSNYIASMAAYYFSATQRESDNIYLAKFLEQHADRDPNEKWWWIYQAVYLANHKLKDKDYALKLAYKLAKVENKDMPIWGKQMPAFIYEQKGEFEESLAIMSDLLDNYEDMNQYQLNFMSYFIKDRVLSVSEEIKKRELEKVEKMRKNLKNLDE